MSERPLKVIISSTGRDLSEYRIAVAEACRVLGLLPILMEDLPAGVDNALSTALRTVNEADIYIGMFAHRYGYVPSEGNPDGISIVELEYNHAKGREIPCLIFMIDEDYPVKTSDIEPDLAREKLRLFKERLKKDRFVSYFTSPENLRLRVIASLEQLLPQISNHSVQEGGTPGTSEKLKKLGSAQKKTETKRIKKDPGVRVLQRGMSGDDVAGWQRFLGSQGFDAEVDGDFGKGTFEATSKFQGANGLPTDGMVGPATLAKAEELRTSLSSSDSHNPGPAEQVPEPPPVEAEIETDEINAPPGESVFRDETSAEAGEMAQIQAEMDEEREDQEPPEDQPVEDQQSTSSVSQSIADVVRKFMLAASAAVSNATSDQAVLTIEDDKLGFAVYAIALRDFIASKDTSTPLTLSIEARWGQGKSSLMRMVQNELNPRRKRRVRLSNWLKLQWWRICWLIATPIWYLGGLIAGLGLKYGPENRLFADLAEGLSYTESKTTTETHQTDTETKIPTVTRLMAWCVKRRLTVEAQHPTVWFNAWKYDKEEEIWSALATSILDQIKHSRWWPARVGLWANLQWRRANKVKALRDVFWKILWPVAFGGLIYLWTTYSDSIFATLAPFLNEAQLVSIKSLQGTVTALLSTGLFVSLGVKFASILDDPFSLSLEKYVTAPDYKQKIGFIGEFEADFRRIVKIVTRPVWGWKPRKLIIFIDDLDRCEPPKSADVIEAINVFLDSVGCVFVLGMDSGAVIASIETKYEKMFQRLQQDDPTNPTLGRDFLEKIIQVPFAIPPVSDKSMSPYLINIIGTKPQAQETKSVGAQEVPVAEPNPFTGLSAIPAPADMPVVTPAGEAAKEDLGSYGDREIWEAIETGVTYLEPNPRQMKRFINLFRLQVYISRNRELFYEYGSAGETATRKGYTPARLAAWTAFSMRWPLIVSCLAEETQQEGLRKWLLHISTLVGDSGGWGKSETCKASLKKSFNEFSDGRFLFSAPETTGGGAAASKGKKGAEANSPANNTRPGRTWRDLPWEHYLGESDFLRVVKTLESWWTPPESKEEFEKQRDSLSMALTFE